LNPQEEVVQKNSLREGAGLLPFSPYHCKSDLKALHLH